MVALFSRRDALDNLLKRRLKWETMRSAMVDPRNCDPRNSVQDLTPGIR